MRGVLLAIALAAFVAATPSHAAAAAAPDHAVVAVQAVPPVFALQENPVKDVNVDINVNHAGGRWYANPLWIGIGALAVIVILLVVVLAARGSGGTTIVRE